MLVLSPVFFVSDLKILMSKNRKVVMVVVISKGFWRRFKEGFWRVFGEYFEVVWKVFGGCFSCS